ncbi:MAG TPA: caspase family protein [Gemmataceae bacterium]
MFRAVRILAAVSFIAWAGRASADDKPKPIGEKYALLIGVRQYGENELRPLQFAEADVVQLAQVLRDSGYRSENVVLMTQARGAENHRFLPLAANVRKELRLLLKNRTRADSVIVAFAGHGVEFRDSKDHYFCPMDAALSDRQTLVSLTEVYKELERCRAGFRLLLADACRNDPVADHSRRVTADLTSVSRPQTAQPPGGVAALFSCSAGELAFEHDDLKHGVFFHYLIKGLQGDADLDGDRTVSLSELDLYVKKRVPDFVRGKYGKDQNPNLVGNTRGLVPVVSLARARKASAGIQYSPVNGDLAGRLKLEPGTGLRVGGVVPDGPAERAGLRVGDVLLRLNGQPLRAAQAELAGRIAALEPGTGVTLDLLRDDAPQQLRVVLEATPPAAETAGRYRKAADRGEAWAQRELAKLYANGHGVSYDEAEAVKWYRKAADGGDLEATFRVGYALDTGRGVKQDHAEAATWYRRAADRGHNLARNDLGVLYRTGRGVARDEAEAAKWYRLAAEQGLSVACDNLGFLYQYGLGVAKDPAEAVKWYRKAADAGLARGQYHLARAYLHGSGVAKDEAEAVNWFRKAAERDHRDAQFDLGVCYRQGRGVPKDEGEAARWLREAADQGHARAQVNLGWLYAQGQGVSKDEAEAARWYREAADQGDANAQFNLGWLYDNGLGVAKDEAEAVKWYRKAADQGHRTAQFNLGASYRDGQGVAKDHAEAVKWFRKAADQGDAKAQYSLGRAYAMGRGVTKDVEQAKTWLRKAAAQKNADAQKLLDELAKG